MRLIDPQIPKAKQAVMQLFEDKWGRAKKKPYFLSQIAVLFEDSFSYNIVYQAAIQLCNEGKLSKSIRCSKNGKRLIFLNHSKFCDPKYKPSIDTHIHSILKIVNEYSEKKNTDIIGNHLESLVRTELERLGFEIIGTHTNKTEKKAYTKGKSTLDFIAKHKSDKLTIGVEVKNTLSVLDKKEVKTKIDICHDLGITPVFAVRQINPHLKLIKDNNGFSWIFKNILYPQKLKGLAELSMRLDLPIEVSSTLPLESVNAFEKWVVGLDSKKKVNQTSN
jgi:hypothetical protein